MYDWKGGNYITEYDLNNREKQRSKTLYKEEELSAKGHGKVTTLEGLGEIVIWKEEIWKFREIKSNKVI